MSAHRHDAAAGPAHVAEQQLEDAGGADGLHAGGVLRPPDRVDDRRRPLASGIFAERLRDLDEIFAAAAGDRGYHRRRIAGVVAPQDVQDTARVLQCRVGRGRHILDEPQPLAEGLRLDLFRRVGLRDVSLSRVVPGRPAGIVAAAVGMKAVEQSAVVLGVNEVVRDNRGGIGVGQHVLPEPALARKYVVDQSAKEGDVRPGADGDVLRAHR